ncbi:MAG TPA: ribosome silencing factor [Acidobacteriaceae bacterium]|nr:ribosome silencing factor [Acidobacteriaceae bacterium]
MAAAEACEDKKAEDTRILELDAADAGFTDFFLISSGANERQTQAIADEVELRLKRDFQTYPNSVEGRRRGEWILMDYVDFVVHIFLTEKRAYYDIERLRKSAQIVDLDELKAVLVKKTASARAKPAKKIAAKKPQKKTAKSGAAARQSVSLNKGEKSQV